MPQKKRAIFAYVPVLHQGYLNFFAKYPDVKMLYLVDQNLTEDSEPLVKDIRVVPAAKMKKAIEALGIFNEVNVAGKVEIEKIVDSSDLEWILPDEEFMHEIAQKYFSKAASQPTFDSTFLRWDRKNILANTVVNSAEIILPDEFNILFLNKASELKEKSADWWRQVGAVLAIKGELVLTAWNHHLPSALEPYFNGDPRASFHKGEYIELSSAQHAEASLIAEAAKKGISTEGADLYVTTFPCPVCAKLVAEAGIKKVYFSEGYAMLDGETLLQAKGVKIYKVTE